MKKRIVIGVLAASALMLAACGSEGTKQPESNTSAATEQDASKNQTAVKDDKKADADQSASEEKKDTSDKSGSKVVEPQDSKTDLKNLSGDYQVAFSTSDIKQDDDGVTVHLTVYEQELFAAEDVKALAKGDTIVLDGQKVKIASIEKASSSGYTIKDAAGEEYSLAVDKDSGSFYELGVSDSLTYRKVGETDLPLSVNFVYKDQSDLNEKGRTATQEDFKEIVEENQTSFSESDTTATVKNGEITVINKAYRP